MPYTIRVASRSVEKPLAAVPQDDRDFVVTRIRNLAEQPRGKGIKTLARDVYRLRIGRYRVIYKILERDPMYAREKRSHGAPVLGFSPGTQLLPPIRNYQPPRRQERQDQKGSLGETNGTSEGPMSALSGSLVERSEHRTLGDLGVMAVQVFSRIRPSFCRAPITGP